MALSVARTFLPGIKYRGGGPACQVTKLQNKILEESPLKKVAIPGEPVSRNNLEHSNKLLMPRIKTNMANHFFFITTSVAPP